MTETKKLHKDDIDFFIENLAKIKSERIYEIPSDYVEKVRYIPKGLSPKPGFFEFSFTPYFKEPFNLLASDSGINEIVLMKPSQIGYNVAMLENAILYFIGSDPKYVQFITADKELAKEMVKERIDPMIDHAQLRHLIFAQSKRRGSNSTGDTSLHKEYPGGAINFVGAKNPDAFRGRTRQISLLDEIDTYQDDAREGSKIGIIKNRSNAFAETRKIMYGSTPLITQSSKIWYLYQLGDQRNYFIPCPKCENYIVLKWHIVTKKGKKCGIIFETENNAPIYESVRYRCQICNKDFRDDDKAFFLLGGLGEWRKTAKAKVPRLASFWINSLYSPPGVYSWEKIVQDWSEAWDFEKNRVKDIMKYREFRNTKQGLPFEEKGTQIKYEKVVTYRRTGFILGKIPEKKMIEDTGGGAMILTCATDMGSDVLYVDTKAWTTGGQSWTIDFFPLYGEPTKAKSKIWKDLDDYICNKRYVTDSGKVYHITITFIDSGWGKYTDVVYEFCKNYISGVYPIKGEEHIKDGLLYTSFSQKTLEKAGLSEGLRLNSTQLKNRVQNYLSNLVWNTGELQPEWYSNFPENLHDDYFKMFEAEQKVDIKHKITNQWIKTIWKQQPGTDNHAFDTFYYNLGALIYIADRTCRENLGLRILSWPDFWDYCKTGIFYNEVKK